MHDSVGNVIRSTEALYTMRVQRRKKPYEPRITRLATIARNFVKRTCKGTEFYNSAFGEKKVKFQKGR